MGKTNNQENYSDIMKKSMDRAFRGGISGGIAMAINICTLMPLRTAVNYQYRYGSSTLNALKTFLKQMKSLIQSHYFIVLSICLTL